MPAICLSLLVPELTAELTPELIPELLSMKTPVPLIKNVLVPVLSQELVSALVPVLAPVLTPINQMTILVSNTRSVYLQSACFIKPWRSCLGYFGAITTSGWLPVFNLVQEQLLNSGISCIPCISDISNETVLSVITKKTVNKMVNEKSPDNIKLNDITNIFSNTITNTVSNSFAKNIINEFIDQSIYQTSNTFQHQKKNFYKNSSKQSEISTVDKTPFQKIRTVELIKPIDSHSVIPEQLSNVFIEAQSQVNKKSPAAKFVERVNEVNQFTNDNTLYCNTNNNNNQIAKYQKSAEAKFFNNDLRPVQHDVMHPSAFFSFSPSLSYSDGEKELFTTVLGFMAGGYDTKNSVLKSFNNHVNKGVVKDKTGTFILPSFNVNSKKEGREESNLFQIFLNNALINFSGNTNEEKECFKKAVISEVLDSKEQNFMFSRAVFKNKNNTPHSALKHFNNGKNQTDSLQTPSTPKKIDLEHSYFNLSLKNALASKTVKLKNKQQTKLTLQAQLQQRTYTKQQQQATEILTSVIQNADFKRSVNGSFNSLVNSSVNSSVNGSSFNQNSVIPNNSSKRQAVNFDGYENPLFEQKRFENSKQKNNLVTKATTNTATRTESNSPLIKMVTELTKNLTQTMQDLQSQLNANQQQEQQRFQQLMNTVNNAGISLKHSAQVSAIPTNLPPSFFDPL